MSNIRNWESFIASHWDWSPYNDCFSSRGRIGDIDGCVERNGRFLFIETKNPGVPVPPGQQILFESLMATGVCTVLIVWGKTNQPECALLIKQTTGGGVEEKYYAPCTEARLGGIMQKWFQWADRQVKPPTPRLNVSPYRNA